MKAEFTCVIIDEDIAFAKLFSEKITALYGNIAVTGTAPTWPAALSLVRDEALDIVFLESVLQQRSSIDLLRMVPNLQAEAIFVTHNSEYAIQAFNAQAAGYILKPVDDNILVKTVDRALKLIHNRRIAASVNSAIKTPVNTRIGIPNNRGLEYLDINNIVYFEATSRYTKVVEKDKELLSSYNIGKFKQLVADHPFHQVHRSFIVNLNCIRRYDVSGVITMTNGKEIPVSKGLREDFLKVFDRVGRNLM